jgi:hypothetical protein
MLLANEVRGDLKQVWGQSAPTALSWLEEI